ncbi:hypothetical protein BUALT_Bualt03G0212600 [Buddleja alternifolia]|uniref:Uncharacterized protein n=1 Tax=Buddleja alternifolia TaxID=168488 RepID=A0AAV6Y2V8_9LAMI|nr:hypothetical protein BUALT_Bualt03G0212600 [Buddleja alternifolia]
MKEAARASEALGRTEIKALSNSETKCEDVITLTFEEYSSLISKAREAEQGCKNRVVDAMVRVDEVNVSKTEILKKVEAATEEVKISKKALEEVLSRVEEANRDKVSLYICRLPTMCPWPGHRVSRITRCSATGCPVGQATGCPVGQATGCPVGQATGCPELPDARQPGAPSVMPPCAKNHPTSSDRVTTRPCHRVPRPTRHPQATMCPDPPVAHRPGPRVRPRPGHRVPRPTRRSGDTRG